MEFNPASMAGDHAQAGDLAIEAGGLADASQLRRGDPIHRLHACVFGAGSGQASAALVQLGDDLGALGIHVRPGLALQATLEAEGFAALDGLVLIEALQPNGAELAALSQLDTRMAAARSTAVVATSLEGLDGVFGVLSQSDVQILVEPKRADWLVACGKALARLPQRSSRPHALQDISSEDRLLILRLSEQLASIAEKLDASPRLQPGWSASDHMIRGDQPDDPSVFSFNAPKSGFRGRRQSSGDGLVSDGTRNPGAQAASIPSARILRRMLRHRQQRGRIFGAELFADPAWDMLLDLAAAHQDGQRVSVTSLCIASGVPPTTALRWFGLMTDAGLVAREEDPADRRRAFLMLTEQSLAGLRQYFEDYGSMD